MEVIETYIDCIRCSISFFVGEPTVPPTTPSLPASLLPASLLPIGIFNISLYDFFGRSFIYFLRTFQ